MVDKVGGYVDAGAEWVILAMRAPFDRDGLERFAAEVMPASRDSDLMDARRAALRPAHRRVGQHRRRTARRARTCPSDGCPFCVGGLEAPEPYDVRWFANRWPALAPGAPIDSGDALDGATGTAAAAGASEVVLFSPDHDESLATLAAEQVRKVVDLWAERTEALLARPEIEYVLVFENRGARSARRSTTRTARSTATRSCRPVPGARPRWPRRTAVRCARRGDERRATGTRSCATPATGSRRCPFASGYPYGALLAPREHVAALAASTTPGRDELARRCVDLVGRYDRLSDADRSRTCSGCTRACTCTCTSRRRSGRAGRAALRRVGRARQRHAREPGRPRGRGRRAARGVTVSRRDCATRARSGPKRLTSTRSRSKPPAEALALAERVLDVGGRERLRNLPSTAYAGRRGAVDAAQRGDDGRRRPRGAQPRPR